MSEERQVVKYEDQYKRVQGLLEKSTDQLLKVLPESISPDKLIGVALTTWRAGGKLADCHPMSFVGAVVECAQLGLMPDNTLQHVHIVPFWNSSKQCYVAQIVIGYRGFVYLARSSGEVNDINAQVRFAEDKFSFSYGTQRHLNHSWDDSLSFGERGAPTSCYMIASLANGEQHFEVWSWKDVLAHRQRVLSEKFITVKKDDDGNEIAVKIKKNGGEYVVDTPWVGPDLLQMGKKTLIRVGAKLLPLKSSNAFQRAASLDERGELGFDQKLIQTGECAVGGAPVIVPVGSPDDSNVASRESVNTKSESATKSKAQELREKLASERKGRDVSDEKTPSGDDDPDTDDAPASADDVPNEREESPSPVEEERPSKKERRKRSF